MIQSDIIDRPHGSVIAAERVKGTEVFNSAGEKLGSIDSIYIDKHSGEVAYVVMSFGGVLGIGEKYHPLPWALLDYDTELTGYRIDVDRNDLDNAPRYSRDDVDRLDQDRDMAGIDSYYAPLARRRSAAYDNDDSGLDQHTGERPAGFYSAEQQAARSRNDAVDDDVRHDTVAPGFYSPEQQASRNRGSDDDSAHLDKGREGPAREKSGGADADFTGSSTRY